MKPMKRVPKDKEKSLGKLPTKVRNRMGYMQEGGKAAPKLEIYKTKIAVDAPKGFHWMLEDGRYYLMKGDYKPHAGAVKKAMFRQANHPKS
tara:strand:+ start:31 stop:303 length:273 start_codon:yes stop_codon:yes gene_type:complete